MFRVMRTDEEPSGLVLINKKERVNGWSCPLHPFQIIAWFFIVALPVVYYGILVAHLPKKWIPAGCIIPGSLLFIHIIFHLVCLSLDPADPKVRQQKVEKAVEFSRAKHKHVIENDHCYICQVDVGRKSKHCALCNKCISEFDHHCKWLNNCIGGQNYKLFISCLVTALATALALLAFCLYLFIMFFKNEPAIMVQQAWTLFGNLHRTTFVSITGVVIVLLLVTMVLLGHLLCFHIFLIRKGLSTYDFIVQNRQTVLNISTNADSGMRPPMLKPCKKNKISHDGTANESIEMNNKPTVLSKDHKIDIGK